ncbi:hypothetical protein R3P38DRAFT_3168443 [Favolaschia claudopus]|uniref:Uncharacterized protein n=1 Tax=Favolaschia claudopus TaxID=2862362 RepID=A0AAW0EAM4_9AGAR
MYLSPSVIDYIVWDSLVPSPVHAAQYRENTCRAVVKYMPIHPDPWVAAKSALSILDRLIPKLFIQGHQPSTEPMWNLSILTAERIEMNWAEAAVSHSGRQMRGGIRQDTLEPYLWNEFKMDNLNKLWGRWLRYNWSLPPLVSAEHVELEDGDGEVSADDVGC